MALQVQAAAAYRDSCNLVPEIKDNAQIRTGTRSVWVTFLSGPLPITFKPLIVPSTPHFPSPSSAKGEGGLYLIVQYVHEVL